MSAISDNPNDNLVIFKVGPVPCCVNSQRVLAVIEPPAHITAIPGSNAFRPGLFSYQKRAVAVYDVRTKFSLSTEQRGKIMLAEINCQLFGFWVDQIQQIALASQGRMQILPAECPKELFESLFILNDQLIFKTSFEALSKAQVSTRAQQFIQQYVQEKTGQQQSADEITTESTSPTSSKIAKQQQPLPTEIKNAKQVTRPLEIDSVNTPKASPPETVKITSHELAIKSSPDKTLGNTSQTTTPLRKTRTAATEFRNKDTLTTTEKSEVKNNYTHPVSPTDKQADLSQQKNYISAQKTSPIKTNRSNNSRTNEYLTHSSKLGPETKTNRENSHPTSAIRKTNTPNNKTNAIPTSDTLNTHSYSTQKTQAAKKTPASHNDESNSSSWAAAIFIIILLLPSFYFGWDFIQIPETKSDYRPLNHKYEPKQEQIDVINNEEIPIEQTEATNTGNVLTRPDNLLERNTISETNTILQEAVEESIAEQTSYSESVSDDVNETVEDDFSVATESTNDYQADIEKSDDDITITLSGPDVEFNTTETKTILDETPATITEQQDSNTQKSSEPEEQVEKNTKSETPVEAVIVMTDNSNKEITSNNKSTSNKIIHIVVKGDTLWHIAKRYVRNPFKYNELARLSKIKNPDLIYPGNRVIILIKKNKQ